MELQPSVSPPRAATFYAALEPFTEFADVADPARYVAAPDDWIVVLGDIKGSTEAARAGRYKEVNLVGAACITATLNVTGDLDLPYAFGGDGATVLIPPEVRDARRRCAAPDPTPCSGRLRARSPARPGCGSGAEAARAATCWLPSISSAPATASPCSPVAVSSSPTC